MYIYIHTHTYLYIFFFGENLTHWVRVYISLFFTTMSLYIGVNSVGFEWHINLRMLFNPKAIHLEKQ